VLFIDDSEQQATLHATFESATQDVFPGIDLHAFCDGEAAIPSEGQAAIDAMRGHLQGGDPHTWVTQFNPETGVWDVAAIDVLIFKPGEPGHLLSGPT
jgi:hypothetical protein